MRIRSFSPAAALATAVVLLVLAGSSPLAGAAELQGAWFGNAFFGDPADPATPRLPFTMIIHTDGTFMFDSTAETGGHPFFPAAATPLVGVWERTIAGSIVFRGLTIFDNAGADYSVLQVIIVGNFDNSDQISGISDTQSIPCVSALDCPDVTQLPFVEIGPAAFPFSMQRFDP